VKAPATASPSSAAPLAGTASAASPSNASSATTATATAHTRGRPLAPSSASPRRYTRPRRPQTNGKAEALVKTLLREWAYRFAYPTSSHRARALPGYLRWYNQHRPHSSLGGRPPISRVSQVCGSHN
jgi:transposase InsO family protein